MRRFPVFLFLTCLPGLTLPGCTKFDNTASDHIRVVTVNLEDIRTEDLFREDHPRLRAAARNLQLLRPDIVLINEIAYDERDVPGFPNGVPDAAPPGSNGQRFADRFLAVSQGMGLRPLRFNAFMAPSNTGQSSGFDLDHDGQAVTEYPEPPVAAEDGTPAAQTPDGRLYGNDCWGFGTFPGQYAMAVLVRDDFDILRDDTRTFQHFLWKELPGAERPMNPETGTPWYSDEVWDQFPLSSKSHWDVPVRLSTGRVLHVLASHPTPAAFDGPENRNKLRNRDEIQFWNAYLSNAPAIRDDNGIVGGLGEGSSFVILGDLNADPDEGSAIGDPVGTFLLSHPAVNGAFTPLADSAGIAAFPQLDQDDTAGWGMRVDYILPSTDLTVMDGGIVRPSMEWQTGISDHFPVYLDLLIPAQQP